MHAPQHDPEQSRLAGLLRPRYLVLAMVAGGMITACGGGGGGSTVAAGTPPAETPQGTQGNVVIDPVIAQADAFLFTVDGSQTDLPTLERTTGGSTYASWNPVNSPGFFSPGLKVSFFGDPDGCPVGTKVGAVHSLPGAQLQYAAGLTGITPSQDQLIWVPSGDTGACTGVADRDGPAAVYINPDPASGGMALYTSSGPRGDGQAPFFRPYGVGGQNGDGVNANNVGTYVAFRQVWRQNATVRPWRGAAASARILVNQGVGATELGSAAGSTAQVQQIMAAHFINTTCQQGGITGGRPCQLNYLFHVALQRNNVSDWNSVAWSQTVRVWYDKAQGGIPIIEGPIKDSGVSSNEVATDLPMFSSKGYATEHGPFSNRSFDVRISQAQLVSVLRILTARQTGLALDQVNDAALATMWGADWNNADAWTAESVSTNQEISNPDPARTAWIAGNVRQVYIGPAGN